MSDHEFFSARFRQEREASWRRLEQCVKTLKSSQVKAGEKAAASLAMPALMQELTSSLSVARSISLDAPMIAYLEQLASEASLLLNDEQPPLGPQIQRFFTHIWPQSMRALGWDMLIASGIFFFAFALAFGLFGNDETWYSVFMGWDTRNPEATTEYLLGTLYDDVEGTAEREMNDRIDGSYWLNLATFSAYLFQNNFYVSIFALAGGLLFGTVTLWVLFLNGLSLGAFVALFVSRGLGSDVVGWLSVHGVTEIGAILISGAGGILIGRTMIFVRGQTLATALRAIGPKIAAVVLAMFCMLIIAALIEGFLRQTINVLWLRYVIGWGLGGLWVAYFILAGRDHGME